MTKYVPNPSRINVGHITVDQICNILSLFLFPLSKSMFCNTVYGIATEKKIELLKVKNGLNYGKFMGIYEVRFGDILHHNFKNIIKNK